MERIFIVGCPRSGTTLLQSIISAHPDVVSFPESHFFPALIPQNHLLRIAGLASPEAVPIFQRFLDSAGLEHMKDWIPQAVCRARPLAEAFVRVLDTQAHRKGKKAWVEKTPAHLLYIPYISRLVPQPRFIHIIRSGKDVIASMYEVTNSNPEQWEGSRSIKTCIYRWERDISISRRCRSKRNHLIIQYEHCVQKPAAVLRRICRFIDISYTDSMLSSYSRNAAALILSNEPWKAGVHEPLSNANNKKFHTLFNEKEQCYILDKIKDINLQKEFPEPDDDTFSNK